VSARWHTAYVTADGVQVEDHEIDRELDGDDDATLIPEAGFHDPRTLTKTETCLARVERFHRCHEEAGLMRD
jgi:ParB family chromosome partitioning protein